MPIIISTGTSGGGAAQNSFTTIQPDSGTSPTATSPTDTLTITSGGGITVAGNSATNTITLTVSGTGIGGFTTGSVLFASGTGTITEDNTNFFFDDATNTLRTSIFSSSAGSVSAPAYTFTGDTNTGMYSPTADEVWLAGGGSPLARFSTLNGGSFFLMGFGPIDVAYGKIRITQLVLSDLYDPSNNLSLHSDVGGLLLQGYVNSSANIGLVTLDGVPQAASQKLLVVRNNGSAKMSVGLDGSVGAGTGTASPGAQLDVKNSTASQVGAIVTAATSQSANLQEWQNSSSTPLTVIGPDGFYTYPGQSRVSSQFDKVNATLANVTGLTATLLAGKTYQFEAVLFVDADATGGSKYAIAGTATATAVIYEIELLDNTTSANTITSRQTALAGSAGQAGTTAGLARISGLITVNAAGTLTVQFAQNTANGTSSVLVGSYFIVQQIV